MRIQDTIDFLYSLQWRGMKVGLENMTRLMGFLGNPHLCFPSIHIAGTNGKGSTAAILASILQAQGIRVGLYTSPHLVDFNERIRVNQTFIQDEDLVLLTHEIQNVLSKNPPSFSNKQQPVLPTFFEFTTAMAFLYFAREGVEMAVVEVGMGGRFDATNLLIPEVSIITQIERDHCQHLGNQLEQIAFEKAGIIKPTVPVVTSESKKGPLHVIRSRAIEEGSSLICVHETAQVKGEEPSDFSYHGPVFSLDELFCPLKGVHQIRNAATALAALEILSEKGYSLETQNIRLGLKRVKWEGRLQIVEENPLVILDGAHNPSAAMMLSRALKEMRRGRQRVILVIGMLKDKDFSGFFNELIPLADEVILTRPDYERAASVSQLEVALQPYPVPYHCIQKVSDAMGLARSHAIPRDLICVTGSLYTAGEVKAHLEGRVPSLLKG